MTNRSKKHKSGSLFDKPKRTRSTKRNTDVNIMERVAKAYNTSPAQIAEQIGYDRTAYYTFCEQGSMPEVAHQLCELMLERVEGPEPAKEPALYVVRVPDHIDTRDAFTSFCRAMGIDCKPFK